jgi:hypothetical protein
MREVMWRRDDGGVAHVRAEWGDGEVDVDGVVAWPEGGVPHRVRYALHCDAAWRVRSLRVAAPEDGGALELRGDGAGAWVDGSGAALPHLDGCVDVDLYAVAFTNTLPVRRLAMAAGEAHVIDVAFVHLPSMEVEHMQQRYTRVSDRVYRYESVSSGFTADLVLDGDGLVVDYPGLVRRMWSR